MLFIDLFGVSKEVELTNATLFIFFKTRLG